MTIASWRMPLRFDPARLLADLALVGEAEWAAHYNTGGYDGEWGGVALRAPAGGALPLFAGADSAYEDTPLLARCGYFAEVLAAFACQLRSARLLRLRAGSVIREHRDDGLGLEQGELRVHIPIVTNPGVRFLLQGREVTMAPGEAWYVNVSLPHSVENTGAADRIHLVVDMLVNGWVLGLLAEGGATEALPDAPRRPQRRAAAPPRPPAPPGDPDSPVAAQIIAFLREIGLAVREGELPGKTFLPGIEVAAGGLVVDRARLSYPGDLLHEAGHLAVIDPERRGRVGGNVGSDPAEEMMAIAWSYAAAAHLGLDPSVVFHDDGYRGGGSSLREAYASGSYVGLPMLQWVGMALDARQAEARGLPAYPAMLHWLRQNGAPPAE